MENIEREIYNSMGPNVISKCTAEIRRRPQPTAIISTPLCRWIKISGMKFFKRYTIFQLLSN